uniref:Uncharacterized protein n=1 Tax=Chlamydomonas leiostraca TaxID=1034604 RepID=A0A7S0REP4_9CHLO|mmetsp:Transcript_20341/g.51531  ORF Transcript_20341/g.51531 Transcript_20341/m.51531 type:complete len:483 (+) Transcript_20341:174-1622(+)
MEDSVLQSMSVRGPRVQEVPCDPSPPAQPSTSTQRGNRGSWKGYTSSNAAKLQREAQTAFSPSQFSADNFPTPTSRPLDLEALSDDGLSSPSHYYNQPQQPLPLITMPLSPSNSRHAPMVPARPQGAGGQLVMPMMNPSHRTSVDRNIKYRTDMRMAREGHDPIARYKGVTQLLNGLRREYERAGFEEGTYDKMPCESSGQMDLLTRVAEVGETLCTFGNTDQLLVGSNSGRAINARDYAYLLKTYCRAFWTLYQQAYIDTLPQTLADEFLSIRGLLMVRCETNDIIADQLMRNVGLENKGAAAPATVINTSVVTSNPVNRVMAAPVNHVKTLAQAASKAMHTSQNKLGAIALGSLAGLWLLKRTGALGLVGLAGGRGRRRGALLSEETEGEGGRQSGSRRSGGARGARSKEERLLAAFEHVDKSWKELAKAQANAALLESDWRLGHLRLAAPLAGPYPPGYQRVDMEGCDPRNFMHQQLGR